MLNRLEVKAMFENECILIGERDIIPIYKAVEIFGEDATKFALKMPNDCSNSYGIGDYQFCYLTYKGFQVAATYANIDEIRIKELPHWLPQMSDSGVEDDG